MSRIQELTAELEDARREFVAALTHVDPALVTAPGLLGEWSARELVAHMGYWCGHGAEALHLASQGRLAEFVDENFDVDARNATVARVARETDYGTVRAREEAAYAAFLGQLGALEPALLEARAPYGASIEEIVRENGSEHYREHTTHLREWWTGEATNDDDDDGADDGSGA
ncbi:MAG: hypothetical protein ABR509_06095 [Candidatus Limnocylindria bacterium]